MSVPQQLEEPLPFRLFSPFHSALEHRIRVQLVDQWTDSLSGSYHTTDCRPLVLSSTSQMSRQNHFCGTGDASALPYNLELGQYVPQTLAR